MHRYLPPTNARGRRGVRGVIALAVITHALACSREPLSVDTAPQNDDAPVTVVGEGGGADSGNAAASGMNASPATANGQPAASNDASADGDTASPSDPSGNAMGASANDAAEPATGDMTGTPSSDLGETPTQPVDGAAGTGAEPSEAEDEGANDEGMGCAMGAVAASEVVFIGESFIAATGAIPRFTTQLARQAGTVGTNESYRSYAVSGTQLTTGDIPGQFTRAVREGPVKVVLMDGGGNDLLIGSRCQSSFDARCEEIVATVEALFAEMKSQGVQDVVYFFYPDPMGIGARIKAAMDILRPEMQAACELATDVRCVWVDQRESWEGHYDQFTSDGIHPTDAGSMASAQQIWDAMQSNCIAQ